MQLFWSGLAAELERQGRWRDLLSLTERLHYMAAVPARDRLMVLGYTLGALSHAGRHDHCRRLLETSGVGAMLAEAKRKDVAEYQKQSPLQSPGHLDQGSMRQHQAFICKWLLPTPNPESVQLADQAGAPRWPLIFDFLLKQGCDSPRALNQALRRCGTARQVKSVLASLQGLLTQGPEGKAQYEAILTENISKHIFYMRRALGRSSPKEVDDVERMLVAMKFDCEGHPILLGAKCVSLSTHGGPMGREKAGQLCLFFLSQCDSWRRMFNLAVFDIIAPKVLIKILCDGRVGQRGGEFLRDKLSAKKDMDQLDAAVRELSKTLEGSVEFELLRAEL